MAVFKRADFSSASAFFHEGLPLGGGFEDGGERGEEDGEERWDVVLC